MLQRCGVSLVSKSVNREQDIIGKNFLSEVKERKKDVVKWDVRRKLLGKIVATDLMTSATGIGGSFKVNFVADDFSHYIYDLGKKRF